MRKEFSIGLAAVLGVLVTGAAIAAERPEELEEISELLQRLRAARQEALFHETVGPRGWPVGTAYPPSPQVVTPPGSYALSIDGDFALGGFVFKDGVPFLHNDGGYAYGNTALGLNALVSSTPGVPNSFSGGFNTAVGYSALRNNTEASSNTATGSFALYYNTEGYFNTASGASALFFNTTGFHNAASGNNALLFNTMGSNNTASGVFALLFNTEGSFNTASGSNALRSNTTGNRNTASGNRALFANTTGTSNTAIGRFAGSNWTTGSYNIAVGGGASGVAAESGTIRIGGSGFQTRAFIEGISGVTVAGGSQVFIKSDGQLGTSTSSVRFKQAIRDLRDEDGALMDLRPVSFRYKDDLAAGGENPIEYGLIAEEVAEVFPQLVVYDDAGQPYSVRYHLLPPLLLNELQKQQATLRKQDKLLHELRARLIHLEAGETARGRPTASAGR